jgi:hypothetical protein
MIEEMHIKAKGFDLLKEDKLSGQQFPPKFTTEYQMITHRKFTLRLRGSSAS